ncbi:MAG: hypothetical protein RL380_434, partial [Verrucomicrobiota bacterium]
MFSMNAFLLRRVAVGVAFFALLFQKNSHAQSTNTRPGLVAAKPLFRDPLHDGPTDPTVIWNRAEQKWFMFYTSRRANMTNSANGVEWVHGCQIGIAESTNAGAAWSYRGTANIAVGDSNATYWAPEIVEANGGYHMMLTLVPGIFSDWNHPRSLLHLTSSNLLDWKYVSTLALASDRLIDPCLARLPDGHWRLWYNNERDKKSIYYADSADLFAWTDKGKCPGTNERGGEGPKVFRWNNYWWMIKDIWRGLRVYRSDDAEHWQMQTNDILATSGHGTDDADIGRHCDVVVSGERAFLFYFTHPAHDSKTPASRRSSIQVVELEFKDGVITCARDEPTHINLQPPALPLSEARYKIGVSDLMILKRQKLGAFPLARTLNADGVEVDMGGLGERETFDNALTNAATREQFLAKARELGLAIP